VHIFIFFFVVQKGKSLLYNKEKKKEKGTVAALDRRETG
jgi:hypothetical protein